MTWPDIKEKSPVCDKFRGDWDRAKKIKQNLEARYWRNPLRVDSTTMCGLRTELPLWFWTTAQFILRFSHTPATMGYPLVKISNIYGTGEDEGVLIKPDPDVPLYTHRVVWAWWQKQWCDAEIIMAPENQLREAQATDTWKAVVSKDVQGRSKVRWGNV